MKRFIKDNYNKSNMSLYDTVQLREDLPISFENDGYELTQEMVAKYLESIIEVTNGQIRKIDEYFCRNGSIFDVTGTKLAWGDIAPRDVAKMLGVYYILTEHKSYWEPDGEAAKGWTLRSEDPNSRSPFRDLLPDLEPAVFDPRYVKRNAIARIVDGEIQTSRDLIHAHYY